MSMFNTSKLLLKMCPGDIQLTQDRQDEIERDNKLLLGRLVRAMTTTRIDNWNDIDQRMYNKTYNEQSYHLQVILFFSNKNVRNRKTGSRPIA